MSQPIVFVYAKRPYRWWKLSKRRMHEAFTHIAYGNFEPAQSITGESNAFAQSQSFDEFSSWKDRNYPRSLWFWIVLLVSYSAALAAKYRLGNTQDRDHAVLNLMLVVGCVVQFIAVVTFEANGTAKHFFIFNVLVDFATVLGVLETARLAQLVWERTLSARRGETPIGSR